MSNASVLLIHRQLSARPFEPYLALPWWKRNPLQVLSNNECFALGNGQVTRVQVAPVPIDAEAILHATRSLSPDPFEEIFMLPEEEYEEWQPFFTTFSQTDKASQQPLPDAPTRPRTQREFSAKSTSEPPVQPERTPDAPSRDQTTNKSTARRRKKVPIIL